MLNRTLMIATALTAAGGIAAQADTVGADLSVKGQVLENAANVGTDAEKVVDRDIRNIEGATVMSTGTEIRGSLDQGVVDEAGVDGRSGAELSEPENILAAATKGMMVRTVTGEVIGTVSYTQDQGENGRLVFVELDPASGWPVPSVGIQVKSLQAVETGDALEYAFSADYLRDRIADAMNAS